MCESCHSHPRMRTAPQWYCDKIDSLRFIGDAEKHLRQELSALHAQKEELERQKKEIEHALNEKSKGIVAKALEARQAELAAYKAHGLQLGKERVIWIRQYIDPPELLPALVTNIDDKTLWVRSPDNTEYSFDRLTGKCLAIHISRGRSEPYRGCLSPEDKARFQPEWKGEPFFIARITKPDEAVFYIGKTDDECDDDIEGDFWFFGNPRGAIRYESETAARRSTSKMRICKEALEEGGRRDIVMARERPNGTVVVFDILDRLAGI